MTSHIDTGMDEVLGRIVDWLHRHVRLADGLALLAGGLFSFAFAPFGFYLLAPVALAVLFGLWLVTSPARAAWRGFLFGFGQFLLGVHWVFYSMHEHGNMAWPLAALMTMLFAALLALFVALCGWLVQRLPARSNTQRLWLLMPALWVLVEWFRSWFLTGFPWLNLGAAWVATPFDGLLPILGVYGQSAALAWLAAALAALVSGVKRLTSMMVAPAVLLGLLLLAQLQWVTPQGAPRSVALVQGATPQAIKWRASYLDHILGNYLELTAPHWGTDLIVWPETAIPEYYHLIEHDFMFMLQQKARQAGSVFISGIPTKERKTGEYYNSIVLLNDKTQFYHKRHLVPFGEYIPLAKQFGGLFDILGVPMSGFSSGEDNPQPVRLWDSAIGMAVCYEIAFSAEMLSFMPQAGVLLTVSNNTWFGDSPMPWQTLQLAQVRARENGRPVLSVTNDGLTAFVNARGEILKTAPQFVPTVLTGEIQLMQGNTAYSWIGSQSIAGWMLGNTPVVLLLLIGTAGCLKRK